MNPNRFEMWLERRNLNIETVSDGRVWAYTLISPVLGFLIVGVGAIYLMIFSDRPVGGGVVVVVIGLVASLVSLYTRLRLTLPIINGRYAFKWTRTMKLLRIPQHLSTQMMSYTEEVED